MSSSVYKSLSFKPTLSHLKSAASAFSSSAVFFQPLPLTVSKEIAFSPLLGKPSIFLDNILNCSMAAASTGMAALMASTLVLTVAGIASKHLLISTNVVGVACSFFSWSAGNSTEPLPASICTKVCDLMVVVPSIGRRMTSNSVLNSDRSRKSDTSLLAKVPKVSATILSPLLTANMPMSLPKLPDSPKP